MSEVVAALVGAAIGAIAGISGGGLAALASIRASQIAARAELANKLHHLARAIIRLQGAIGTEDELEVRRDLELVWNDLGVHQRILCPSRGLEVLANIMRRTTSEQSVSTKALVTVAGQAQEKYARVVGLYSEHLFRFRARGKEKEVMTDWLADESRGWLGDGMRIKVGKDLDLSNSQQKRIKPADSIQPDAPQPDEASE